MQPCREQTIPSSVFNGRCKVVTHERRKRAIEVGDDEEPEQIQLPLDYPDDIEVNLLILFMLKEINTFIVVCPFVIFLLAIMLSVLIRNTDSDYPYGIFKLFLIC